MCMPKATTKSYPVDYEVLDSPAKIPAVIGMLLGIGYNIDLNAYVVDGAPVYTLKASRNGANPVTAVFTGEVLVWDNNRLYVYSTDEAQARYTLS